MLMRNPRTALVATPRGLSDDDVRSQRRLNAIGHEIVRDLERDYRAHGIAAIEKLRKEEPWNYLRLLLSLVPQQPLTADDWFSQLTDAQLDELLQVARSALAAQREAEGMPP
jgi:hypothetical protein